MVRSERNIRPVAGARTNPTGVGPDLSQDAHASAVLCNDSVPYKPTSILKSTLCEGSWLSRPTQHAPAPTTEGSAPRHGLQAPSKPGTTPGMPSRPRHVQTSPIISIIDTCGVEQFQKEEIRAFQRSKSELRFKNEIHSPQTNQEALGQKW